MFLVDVDNTLLDNDAVIEEMKGTLTREVGIERETRYWKIFEELRDELGYADYLGTLQRYRMEDPHDTNLLAFSSFLVNYPFADRLYPGALDVIAKLQSMGTVVIFTDGDVVFQPLKIERSGIFDAAHSRVLVYVHKELELEQVEKLYPADHYVLIDDKVRILTAVKASWGERCTTVFPRQGHYAHDPAIKQYPEPDVTIDPIGDLLSAESQLWQHLVDVG
ncbi:MAG: HAD family hydrolase [Longimicrobiales bacterium]